MNTSTQEELTRLYYKVRLIRRIEEYIAEVYSTDVIKSPVHLSIGQEGIAVGICDALEKDDLLANTYRCHATYVAKGGNLKKMMAELYGKATGCAGGKAGSMHLVDMPNGIIGASAIVGTTTPVAAGYALALKLQDAQKDKKRAVVALFGDGSTEEGSFSETLNLAKLKNLPIVLVCENNGYAIHNPLKDRWANEDICARVQTYGIPTFKVESGDLFDVREAMQSAIKIVREENGPVFMECKTYRFCEHVGPLLDTDAPYRNQDEYNEWKGKDPVFSLGQQLEYSTRESVNAAVENELNDIVAFAKASEYPTSENLLTHVYAS